MLSFEEEILTSFRFELQAPLLSGKQCCINNKKDLLGWLSVCHRRGKLRSHKDFIGFPTVLFSY